MLLCDVALPVPLARAFTYCVPDSLAALAVAGARVICSFGGRRMVGVVLAARDGEPPKGAKAIAHVVDEPPAIPEDSLAFLRDLAAYYFAPIGEVMRLALPPLERDTARELTEPGLFDRGRGVGARTVQWVRATDRVEEAGSLRGQAAMILAHVRATGAEPTAKLETRWGSARAAVRKLAGLGLVEVEERAAPEDPFFAQPATRDAPHDATPAQTAAIQEIAGALRDTRAATFLLHGVTGSGKTEVYLQGSPQRAKGAWGRSCSSPRSRSRRSSSPASARASATTSRCCTRG